MEDWTPLTRASRSDDVSMILYGLSIRGIKAQPRETPRRSRDPWEILVAPSDADRARAALPLIWDAVLDLPRAINPDGTCAFCGYDNSGLPPHQPCPECGIDLSSPDARRAHRDGRKPPPEPS